MDDDKILLMRFAKQGYCCSQILALLNFSLFDFDEEAFIKSLAAFCFGQGNGRGDCGILLSALAILAVHGSGMADSKLQKQIETFSNWFAENPGANGIKCFDISGSGAYQVNKCGEIILEAHHKIIEILASSDVN